MVQEVTFTEKREREFSRPSKNELKQARDNMASALVNSYDYSNLDGQFTNKEIGDIERQKLARGAAVIARSIGMLPLWGMPENPDINRDEVMFLDHERSMGSVPDLVLFPHSSTSVLVDIETSGPEIIQGEYVVSRESGGEHVYLNGDYSVESDGLFYDRLQTITLYNSDFSRIDVYSFENKGKLKSAKSYQVVEIPESVGNKRRFDKRVYKGSIRDEENAEDITIQEGVELTYRDFIEVLKETDEQGNKLPEVAPSEAIQNLLKS